MSLTTSPGEIQQIVTQSGSVATANLDTVTAPLVNVIQTGSQFSNFPPQVYNLQPTSHLVKFMRTILGDAGVGQLLKRLNRSRLSQTLQSSSFYDLDSFYGFVFGIQRTPSEQLLINGSIVDPTKDILSQSDWRTLQQADVSYKARLFNFARSIGYAPSALGIRLISEAILGIPCVVQESFVYAAQQGQTFGYFDSNYTFGTMDTFTFGELEGRTEGVSNSLINNQFIISPLESIGVVDAYNLKLVLDVLKPANTVYTINVGGIIDPVYNIPLQNAWADSSYWEIESDVIINGVSTPHLQPPFNSYIGEQWYYNSFIIGSLSYSNTENFNLIGDIDYQQIQWADGSTTSFSPNHAIMPGWQTALSRYSLDGVMSINVLSGAGTNTVNPSVSDLYFDGMSAAQLIQAIQTNTNRTVTQAGINNNLNFWSTDNRNMDDPTLDIIEFRMGNQHVANIVSFDVAHFPQNIVFQYFDPNNLVWVDAGSTSIYDSVPYVLPNAEEALKNKVHPQHQGEGHWDNMAFKFPPVNFQRCRVVLQRIQGIPPVTEFTTMYPDANGNFSQIVAPQPYSLGLRDFKVGFQINSANDLPIAPTGTALDSSTDILGRTVTYKLYSESPNGPIQNSPTQWRCEPQPIVNAVVNYVIDTRDGNGNAQQIDTIYVDPTHIGVHATLYWSNDPVIPSTTNEANDTSLTAPIAIISGNVYDTGTGLQFPQSTGTLGDISIQNSAVQYNPNADWWVGLEFISNATDETGIIPLIDLEGTVVYYDYGNQWFAISPSAGNQVTVPAILPLGSHITLVAGCTSAGWFLSFQIGSNAIVNQFFAAPSAESDLTPLSTYITIGGINDANVTAPSTSGMLLYNLVLKNETLNNYTINSFFTDPSSYTYKGEYYSVYTQDNTNNAVLRYNSNFVTDLNPTGMVGGPTSFYPNINWTPIPGDFVLTKGNISIEPIRASFIRFEMTNLAAEQYEGFMPVSRSVNTFTDGAISPGIATPGNPGSNPPGFATLLNSNLGQSPYPYSQTSPTPPSTTANTLTTSSMGVMVARDPEYAQALAQSPAYSYSDYHQGQSAPMTDGIAPMTYVTSSIAPVNKVSYFCGFKQIALSLTNISAEYDTDVYKEHFYDNSHIESNSWDQQEGMLISPAPSQSNLLPVVAQSQTYFSYTDVTGVQFATQQSEPYQCVTDDSFIATSLQQNNWTDTSTWHAVGDVGPSNLSYNSINSSIIISRRINIAQENAQDPYQIGDIHQPEHLILGNNHSSDSLGYGAGGLANGGLILSPAGRAWVAIRMVPLTPITNPWYLQLIDTITGNPIWESEITGLAENQITEYYDVYDIGSVPNSTVSDVLMVAVVQKGESSDIVEINRLSVFDESIVWEFSNDGGVTFYQATGVRNNPRGSLTFPLPGNQLIWRATCFRNNMYVTYLQMRPLYANKLNRVVHPIMSGPNVNPADTLPDIFDDPVFQTWNLPIPKWWFLGYQQSPNLFPDGVVTNQFSQFINAVESETISGSFLDSASSIIHKIANTFDSFNFSDVANHINGHFTRIVTSDIGAGFKDTISYYRIGVNDDQAIVGQIVQGHEETQIYPPLGTITLTASVSASSVTTT